MKNKTGSRVIAVVAAISLWFVQMPVGQAGWISDAVNNVTQTVQNAVPALPNGVTPPLPPVPNVYVPGGSSTPISVPIPGTNVGVPVPPPPPRVVAAQVATQTMSKLLLVQNLLVLPVTTATVVKRDQTIAVTLQNLGKIETKVNQMTGTTNRDRLEDSLLVLTDAKLAFEAAQSLLTSPLPDPDAAKQKFAEAAALLGELKVVLTASTYVSHRTIAVASTTVAIKEIIKAEQKLAAGNVGLSLDKVEKTLERTKRQITLIVGSTNQERREDALVALAAANVAIAIAKAQLASTLPDIAVVKTNVSEAGARLSLLKSILACQSYMHPV